MSSAGENEGDGFFRLGVAHTMRHLTIFLTLAHNGVGGLQTECYQKRNMAAKVEAVMGSIIYFCPFSFSVVEADIKGLNYHLFVHWKR